MIDLILLKISRGCAAVFRRIQKIMNQRFFNGTRCVVWELPYSDKTAVRALIKLMNMMFPKGHPALKKLVLLVNNGLGGNYEVFLIAAFLQEYWEEISNEINSIPGVTQTFMWSPENLLTLATQGQFYIAASNITPKDVDRLYAKGA